MFDLLSDPARQRTRLHDSQQLRHDERLRFALIQSDTEALALN